MINWLTDWLTDGRTDRQTDWLTDWLTNWLTDWLYLWSPCICGHPVSVITLYMWPNQTKCMNVLCHWINPTTEYCTMWMSHLLLSEWLSEWVSDELLELLKWLFATNKIFIPTPSSYWAIFVSWYLSYYPYQFLWQYFHLVLHNWENSPWWYLIVSIFFIFYLLFKMMTEPKDIVRSAAGYH